MLALLDGKALWYLTRGTGLVSLGLLTLVLVLGIVQVERWSTPYWPRFVTAGLHRNASLLAVAFLGVHIATSVLDGFAPIVWLDAIVPFRSPYRPLWLGFGALALDLLIALVVTSLVRQRLGHRTWRLVHWTSYACWPIAFAHGLGTGTDSSAGWVLAFNLVCFALVVGSVAYRVARAETAPVIGRAGAAAGTACLVVLLLVFIALGPTKPGWARRAGTPEDLLTAAGAGGGATATDPGQDATSPPPSGTASIVVPFSDDLSGTLQQTDNGDGTGTITIDASLSGDTAATLHVELRGASQPRGGIRMSSSTVTVAPAGRPSQYQGTVTRLNGTSLVATVHDAQGAPVTLDIQLDIGADQQTVSGTVSARTAAATGNGESGEGEGDR